MKNSLFIIAAALFFSTSCAELDDIPTPINESTSESTFQQYQGLENPRSVSELRKVYTDQEISQGATNQLATEGIPKLSSSNLSRFQTEETQDLGMVIFHDYFEEWKELYATLYHKNYIGKEMSLEEFLDSQELIEMNFAEWIALQQKSLKYYNDRSDRAEGMRTFTLQEWIESQFIAVKAELALRIEDKSRFDKGVSFDQFWKATIKRFKP